MPGPRRLPKGPPALRNQRQPPEDRPGALTSVRPHLNRRRRRAAGMGFAGRTRARCRPSVCPLSSFCQFNSQWPRDCRLNMPLPLYPARFLGILFFDKYKQGSKFQVFV